MQGDHRSPAHRSSDLGCPADGCPAEAAWLSHRTEEGVPSGETRDPELRSGVPVHQPGVQRIPQGEPCTPEHGWQELLG